MRNKERWGDKLHTNCSLWSERKSHRCMTPLWSPTINSAWFGCRHTQFTGAVTWNILWHWKLLDLLYYLVIILNCVSQKYKSCIFTNNLPHVPYSCWTVFSSSIHPFSFFLFIKKNIYIYIIMTFDISNFPV